MQTFVMLNSDIIRRKIRIDVYDGLHTPCCVFTKHQVFGRQGREGLLILPLDCGLHRCRQRGFDVINQALNGQPINLVNQTYPHLRDTALRMGNTGKSRGRRQPI